jgi:hypothetical protein
MSIAVCLATTGLSGAIQMESGGPGADVGGMEFIQNDPPSAASHIRDLHQGILLVRLPSNRNKIQALADLLAQNDLEARDRERLEKTLQATKRETELMHHDYICAFREEYDFSRYAFFLDYNTPQLRDGKMPIVHNAGSDTEPLPENNWYILSVGHTPNMQIEGMQVLDSTFTSLEKPFPATVLTSGVAGIVAGWKFDNPVRAHVRRLNRKLHKFYRRVR